VLMTSQSDGAQQSLHVLLARGTYEVWVRLDEPVSMTWGAAYVAIPRVKLP
jgi:hypothetical protein